MAGNVSSFRCLAGLRVQLKRSVRTVHATYHVQSIVQAAYSVVRILGRMIEFSNVTLWNVSLRLLRLELRYIF